MHQRGENGETETPGRALGGEKMEAATAARGRRAQAAVWKS